MNMLSTALQTRNYEALILIIVRAWEIPDQIEIVL